MVLSRCVRRSIFLISQNLKQIKSSIRTDWADQNLGPHNKTIPNTAVMDK